jgi:hypothetical protein
MMLPVMRSSGGHTALLDEVARFQAEIERLAFAVVHAVIEEELARRATSEPLRRRNGRRVRGDPRQLELALAPMRSRQLELLLAPHAGPEAAPRSGSSGESRPEDERASTADAVASAVLAPREPAPNVPAGDRRRVRWTRESIIGELATWLLAGTAIDAQFLARYGPRGLVAATRRVFGRFDAALNVAALHNAKLYPDGPPARDARPDWPTPVAASRRRVPS